MPGNALPDKLFFKIGEVAQIVGVATHVLRYWESEFVALRPLKTRGSHRVYRRRDVELAVLLRRLLHEEGLTIAGAKRRLRERGRARFAEPAALLSPRERGADERVALVAMREELTGLLSALDSALRDGADGDRGEEVCADNAADVDENGRAHSSLPAHRGERPVT